MTAVAEPAPPGAPAAAGFEWLRTGDQAFSTMLEAIDGAQHTVRFETYIFRRGEPGDRIRAALTRCRRVNLSQWRKSRGFIARWKEKFAYWLLTRFDLYLARKQLSDLR